MENATLGKLVNIFSTLYGFNNNAVDDDATNAYLAEHDAMHAMTGFGPSIHDEVRVFVFENALARGRRTDDRARENYKNLSLSVGTNSAAVGVMLSDKEMEELYALGQTAAAAIKTLIPDMPEKMGFYKIGRDAVKNLPFALLDFSAAAHEIKNKHQNPQNRVAEEYAVRAFKISAAKRGLNPALIAAPGQPWTKAFAA